VDLLPTLALSLATLPEGFSTLDALNIDAPKAQNGGIKDRSLRTPD